VLSFDVPFLEELATPILPPNGFELSGPAKAHTDHSAELAGSAPASG